MAPTLGKGTKCIKLLCSKASKFMFSPPISMLFPIFGAHLHKTEFLYSMQTWKELCGKQAHLVTKSGQNMGQLTALVPYARISAGMKQWISFPSNARILSLKRSHPFPQTFAHFPSNVRRNCLFVLGNPFPLIFLLNSGKFLMKTIFGGYMNSKNT